MGRAIGSGWDMADAPRLSSNSPAMTMSTPMYAPAWMLSCAGLPRNNPEKSPDRPQVSDRDHARRGDTSQQRVKHQVRKAAAEDAQRHRGGERTVSMLLRFVRLIVFVKQLPEPKGHLFLLHPVFDSLLQHVLRLGNSV